MKNDLWSLLTYDEAQELLLKRIRRALAELSEDGAMLVDDATMDQIQREWDAVLGWEVDPRYPGQGMHVYLNWQLSRIARGEDVELP